MPKFGGRWKRTLGESFEIIMPGLLVIILIFGLSVLVTLFRFSTYDPQ
jgi:hypothetical protein